MGADTVTIENQLTVSSRSIRMRPASDVGGSWWYGFFIINIMDFSMTTTTRRTNIQQMCITIALIVMIMRCTFTAIKTRQCIRFDYSTVTNCFRNSCTGVVLFFTRCRSSNLMFALIIARSATSRQPIATTSIHTKRFARLPSFTISTMLQAVGYFYFIFLKSQIKSVSSNFDNSYPRTHLIPPYIIVWVQYITTIIRSQDE